MMAQMNMAPNMDNTLHLSPCCGLHHVTLQHYSTEEGSGRYGGSRRDISEYNNYSYLVAGLGLPTPVPFENTPGHWGGHSCPSDPTLYFGADGKGVFLDGTGGFTLGRGFCTAINTISAIFPSQSYHASGTNSSCPVPLVMSKVGFLLSSRRCREGMAKSIAPDRKIMVPEK